MHAAEPFMNNIHMSSFKDRLADKARYFGLHPNGGDILPTSSSNTMHPGTGVNPIKALNNLKNKAMKLTSNLARTLTGKGDFENGSGIAPVVIFSWFMLLIGLYSFMSGCYYLKDYSQYSTYECTTDSCTLSMYSNPTGGALFALTDPVNVVFDRSSFDRAAAVRIDKEGTVTKTTNMKRRQMRKLGYSYSVLYTPPEGSRVVRANGGIQEEVVICRANLGKRAARERVSILNQKMRSSARTVRIEEGKSFYVPSLVKIGIGVMLVALMGLIGEFDTEAYLRRFSKMRD